MKVTSLLLLATVLLLHRAAAQGFYSANPDDSSVNSLAGIPSNPPKATLLATPVTLPEPAIFNATAADFLIASASPALAAVGRSSDPTLASVPEPGVFALLGFAVVGIRLFLRRRR